MSSGFSPSGGTDNTSTLNQIAQKQQPAANQPIVANQQSTIQPETTSYAPDYTFPGGGSIDEILSQLQSTLTQVNETKQLVATSITNQCANCQSLSDSIKLDIMTQIITPIVKSQQCCDSCKQTLYTSLAGQTGTALENTGTTLQTLPLAKLQELLGVIPSDSGIAEPAPAIGLYPPSAPIPLVPPISGGGSSVISPYYGGGIASPSFSQPGVTSDTYQNQTITPTTPTTPPVGETYNLTVPTCPPPVNCQRIHLYYGYCNQQNGAIDARRDDEPPPTFPWIQASVATSIAAAQQLAEEYCKRNPSKYEGSISVGKNQKFYFGQISCDLSLFQNESDLLNLFPDYQTELNDAQITATLYQSAETVFGGLDSLPIVGALVGCVKGLLTGPWAIARGMIPELTRLIGCDTEIFLRTMQYLSVIAFWEKLSGVQLGQFRRPYEYILNSRCRSQHVNYSQGIRLYLGGAIDLETCDTIAAINGLCNSDLMQLIEVERSKPVPSELAQLRRRGIYTPEQYTSGMRQLGYIDAAVSTNIYKLSEKRPSIYELIQYAERGAATDSIVSRYSLDAQSDWYKNPQISRWQEDNGITDDQMNVLWQSHWHAPGVSDLFTFWARLRDDRKFGTREEQESDMRVAMTQNGISPFWQEAYLATRYPPLSIRYLSRVYNTGAMTFDQLTADIQQLGHSDENTKAIAESFRVLKIQGAQRSLPIKQWLEGYIDGDGCSKGLVKLGFSDEEITSIKSDAEPGFTRSLQAKEFVAGVLDEHGVTIALTQQGVSQLGISNVINALSGLVRTCPHVEDYRIGTVTRQQAEAGCAQYGMDSHRAKFLLDEIDNALRRGNLNSCINNVKRQFTRGQLNENQTNTALLKLGVAIDRANALTAQWSCLVSTTDKAVPTGTLCTWLGNGQITPANFVSRLENLGYSNADALNIVGTCLGKINNNLAKQAVAEAKQEAAAQAKAQRLADKAAAQIARDNLKIQKAQAARAKAKLRRDGLFIAAANTLQKLTSCDLPTALSTLTTAKQTLQGQYGLTIDETLMILNKAAEKTKGTTCYAFTPLALADAELLVQSQLSAQATETVSGVN